jgi:methoxymalonate biosynthesis acyl carrier protein
VTTNRTGDAAVTAAAIADDLTRFLETKTKNSIGIDQDIFESGTVSSMFALELVVHLEQTYCLDIGGTDLQLNNFRTIAKMTALILRLKNQISE